MTDKQIIIDGVDVSGCASYMDNGECISELVYSDYCKVCPNCTYKLEQKLKAKEQECERWKSNFNGKVSAIKELLEQLDQLKAENDKLKEAFDGLFKVQYKLADNNKKLRQCLTKIKEIAEELKNFYEELGKCEDLTVVRLKQILQKISEVENEN